jgi:hypothetical protein
LDLVGGPICELERKPLNAVDSIKAILTATFEDDPLEADISNHPTVPSPGNSSRTDAAKKGGGLDSNDHTAYPYVVYIMQFPIAHPTTTCTQDTIVIVLKYTTHYIKWPNAAI